MVSLNTGLVSGLDVGGLVDSLIAVEANTQTLLKRKLTATQDDAKAYRAVNTKFDALRTAAEALGKAATFSAATATSSSTSVVATASAGATAGSTTFTVDRLAARHTVATTGAWNPTTDVTLTVEDADQDTAAVSVTIPAGTTLADAVKKINATAGTGVTASIVNSEAGQRLQLTSTASGQDGRFTVSGLSTGVVNEGADAKVTIGGTGSLDFSATSATNTFADLVPGVTLTVSKVSTEAVTVDVASDPKAVTAAVQKLVTAANDVLSSIKTHTSTATGSTAALKGDSTLRGLATKVLESVGRAIGAGTSASEVGIELDRYGALTFDAVAFEKSLAADPARTQAIVHGTGTGATAVPGVAQRLLAVVKEAGDSVTGSLVVKAKSSDEAAAQLQDRIDDWDLRLELRRTTLQKQFTAMETALSSLQNQAGWLSSQLKSLSGSSS
ncbi:flagellar filament capping protein FliD [Geodermatophilus nigrescens]|uniref:Flagellar hook-associated protein 2 n=1 Tax=Geodermatophilus nigrescens TaxID=1070870 RepID=A0A1M5EC43_9ACTN|nr:flagellar filament capping protein FliD [Geodermatophilus nigrescens]SHF76662.1 flagellar hook-associated protein 2 [Geodermatophilus nigrescens]